MSDTPQRPASELTPLQKAFLTIRTLRHELDAAQAGRSEPIAIVGMGCRVPGANDPDAFWRLLSEGRDAIGDVPRGRWDVDALYDPTPGTPGKVYSRQGGYLDQVDGFDAAFFNISAREAASIDPQQRLLLEVAWEALEHAGIAPASLKGTATGVFIGVTSSDYACLQLEQNRLPDDPYFSSGAALNACAGRVSYVFGLQGPCMIVDTACSSSLTAIHLACSALRNRECDAALAGGVNLMLAAWPHVTLAAAQMVAADSRCKTFDASADGYVRGEGCGVVVLKRLSDAVAAGDRVLAVIRGTAVNQDGASSGFTVPNGVAQQALIRRTLAAAGVDAHEIDYVESHGTGTALGDPIEAGALGAVLGRAPGRERPLLIGSVKSNIGHLESAAGVAGLIKLVLALGHESIPRTLHVKQENPKVDWAGLHLRTVREPHAWAPGGKRRLAALSAFGVSGSNAHVIVEEAPAHSSEPPPLDRVPRVLTLSAKSAAALSELAGAYDEWLADRSDDEIADICRTANSGRTHFKIRAAITGSTIAELRAGLGAIRDGRDLPPPASPLPADTAAAVDTYLRGGDVDWASLDGGARRNRVALPTYRFQRKRYWLTNAGGDASRVERDDTMTQQRHRDQVRGDVIALVADMLRERTDEIPLDVPFLEMGADSLILVQAARRLDERFGVKIEIRQFFEEIGSVSSLADYIADRMPAPQPTPAVPPAAPIVTPVAHVAAPVTHVAPVSAPHTPVTSSPTMPSDVADLVRSQMELMSRQLELLSRLGAGGAPAPMPAVPAAAAPAPAVMPQPASKPTSRSSPLNDLKQGISAKPTGMTELQQRSLDAFIERFAARTRRSKALAEACRPHLADSRATVGFRFSTKEILYPITGDEALGSWLRDVDGNDYVDLTMGFGALLFGSRPDFAVRAIASELSRGIQLGMRSDLMEEVSRLFCELTGKQRVVFTNSGTEAVMTALRLARAATGRTKIVLFEGSYHGHSDGTLAQRSINPAVLESEPVAPGIPASVAKDVVVLEYGTPQSLEIIRGLAHELAAVVVEPVQSRRPDFQPVEFLRELRSLTERTGTALIFDEMITGFRAHPAGCQGLFGIEADIATYGKIIGGGMPIGAVAGSAKYLDGIDGGTWRYGDQSYPAASRTYFGGTFCQHPLAMAASLSVLRHLKAEGPALQERLNQRTAAFAATLNQFFESEDLAIRVSHFSSIFRFEFSGNLELFFYHMLEKGVYIWEWRNCFLSTAHTDEDLDRVVRAVQETIADLRAEGFLPAREGTSVAEPSAAAARPSTGFWDRGKSKLGQRESSGTTRTRTQPSRDPNRPLQFSLSYFGSYAAEYSADKYDLLIQGAKFADRAGFEAIWMPERHFHDFGGLSPNPSVLAAALARETTRLQLRAGSVVAPLHHPMRVAEEWSLVDNLAAGRVGVAFASGWHPNDFVFAPHHFGRHRDVTFETMEQVRRIWRGEAQTLRNGAGKDISVALHPMPRQAELPCWLTIVNNQDTYRKAGELGVGVLTNLMGQTLDELSENIAVYRETFAAHGHDPKAATVTVLMHTYVREDAEQAIREARRPLCDYLLSSMTLFKQMAKSHGQAADLEAMSAADREYIVQAAYDKYVQHSALIGSPETCRPIVQRLLDAGIDEIACFVDFGVPAAQALEGLTPLDELRRQSASAKAMVSYPMSEAQQQLWLLARMSDDGARAYNDPAVLTVHGAIDLDLFTQALTTVVARHESLRTTVDPVSERLVVHPPMPVAPVYIDVSNAGDPDLDVRAHLELFNHAVCDFVNGPIFSATLLKVASDRHVLVLGSHHLLTDGLSMVNVINEINVCYAALRQGRPAQLLDPMQYRDFVRWHQAQADSDVMKAHEAYWIQQLARPLAPGDVPSDRPRPAVKTFAGAVRRITMDAALVERATKMAGARGYTPFMLLLAVYQLLLHRLSGDDTIVVGCPSAGRGLDRGDTVVGYCAHLLPIVSTLPASERVTVGEHLRRVRSTLLDAFQHQDYPFARLLNALALKRDVSRAPLVSSIFNLERPSFAAVEGGLQLSPFDRHTTFARLDLTFTANVFETSVVLECDYNTDLFDASTIDRLLRQYRTLLEGVVADPDADVHALPLLDAAARQQQLVEWNRTEPVPVDRCVHHWFEARAAQRAEAIAVRERGGAGLTFRDLNARANQVAHLLRRAGVGPEHRVAVHLRRSADLVAVLLGTMKAGAAYVPVDPTYPAARVEQIMADAQVSMVITQQDLLGSVTAPAPVWCIDRDAARLHAEPTDNLSVPIHLDSPAYVIYTSGSTGRPKGVVVLHRGLTNYSLWAAQAYRADGATPVLGSVSFDATVTSLFVPLIAGGCAELLAEGDELSELASALSGQAEYRFIKITPAHLDAVNRLLPDGPKPGTVGKLVLGGEAIAPTALANWTRHPGVRAVNEYGPTEAVVGCCTFEFGPWQGESVPIGTPISGARLYVLDRNLEPVPVGVTGELFIGGEGVARGYFGRPDLTAAAFVPNPFATGQGSDGPGSRLYRTGDLARYLADGNLEYLGRIDGQIKLRGYRIELGEIEAVLLQHADVREAAVLLREDDPGQPRLVGYVCGAEGATLSVSQVRDDLRRVLPDYMVPSVLVRLDRLPLTTNGKVDRAALPAPDRERPEQSAEFAAPQGATEEAVAAIWREVLHLNQVGAHDNFFDLGGTSLLALEAFRKIEPLATGRCKVLDLFRYPTIRSLAAFIGNDPADTDDDNRMRERVQRQRASARKQANRRRETSTQAGS